MEKIIDIEIECQSCNGTGVYSGMAERDGAALVCHTCEGKGKKQHVFRYNEFTGRKKSEKVKRVYKAGYGFVIGTGVIGFSDAGKVDMSKEGVSYEEFLQGKMPNHIEKLACPMMADQGACHKIDGFTDKCNELNGGWVGVLSKCNHRKKCSECWTRFNNKD